VSTLEFRRNRLRERRKQAIADGKCRTCFKADPAPGRVNCKECLQRHAEASARHYRTHAKGKKPRRPGDEWCFECIAFGFHRDGCPASEKQCFSKQVLLQADASPSSL